MVEEKSKKKDKPISLTGMGNTKVPMPNPTIMPGMPLPNGINAIPSSMGPGAPGMPKKPRSPEEILKDLEDKKKRLEPLKKKILKKYKFTRSLAILPEDALPFFAEDEAMPEDVERTNPMLLLMIFPEEHFKDIQKIRQEVLGYIKESKENIWLMLKTEVDLWNYGYDSKYDLMDAVAAGFPLHDNGFLGSLRVANIHKSLVLRRFEKYVASYVIGGSLVRGSASEDSDIDTFVIIDDTDVKRMSRVELLERLRGVITHELLREATVRAGVKNPLNVQVYLLTDFWQNVKDAHPVMFTFIRDGVPFYDRGTFTPWKLLLKMGKIKPSPEAVDMFMKSGDQTDAMVKRRLIDAMIDIYYGVLTPTQALMMLAGQGPPEPKGVVQEVKKVFVDKEKLMTMTDLKTLEKAVGLFKAYEHGKLKEISGKEIDQLKKEGDKYIKRMKELRGKIEEVMKEKTINKVYDESIDLLKKIFGNKSRDQLLKDLDKELIRKGKVTKRVGEIAKDIVKAKMNIQKKKLSQAEMQKLTSDSSDLISSLTEYTQRKDLVSVEKGILQIHFKGRKSDLIKTDEGYFFVDGDKIKKFGKDKFQDSSKEELSKAIKATNESLSVSFDGKILEALKKEIGEFEIIV